MNVLIFKYGGKALADEDGRKRIIENIKKERNRKIAIIVSAPGREGSPYATETFLKMFELLNGGEKDYLVSFGEIISCYLLKNQLLKEGIASEVIDNEHLGIITDENYQSANVLTLNSGHLKEQLFHNNIIIIPGFQGRSENGKITTLGRGGSDLTAVLIAKMLGSEAVYLYKDVDGVYIGEKDYQQEIIEIISYEEMLFLVKQKVEIVQDKALMVAQESGIKILIISYLTGKLGTIISEDKSFSKIVYLRVKEECLLLGGFFTIDEEKNIDWKLRNSGIAFDSIIREGNFIKIYMHKDLMKKASEILFAYLKN